MIKHVRQRICYVHCTHSPYYDIRTAILVGCVMIGYCLEEFRLDVQRDYRIHFEMIS